MPIDSSPAASRPKADARSRRSRSCRKYGPRPLGVVRVGRQHHEPLDAQRGEAAHGLERAQQVVLGQPELRLLVREVDLDEHGQHAPLLRGGAREPLRQGGPVDRVDRVEERGRLLRLVRLEVADEVEAQPGGPQVGELRGLRLRLLDAVLAEVAEAGREGLAHRGGGLGLADADEADAGGVARDTVAGGGDPFAHRLQSCGDQDAVFTSWACSAASSRVAVAAFGPVGAWPPGTSRGASAHSAMLFWPIAIEPR